VRYLLLVYAADGVPVELPDGWLGADAARTLRAAYRLEDVSTATSVRVRGDETLVDDAPFAETEERLAGVCVLDAPSLDEAIEAATAVPAARIGVVEIRPVVCQEAAA
jgi:hypothetical protein